MRLRDGGRAGAGVLTVVVVAGLWPVWRWYLARTTDGSDDPLGLIALAAAAWFLPRSGWARPVPPRRLLIALGALVVHLAMAGLPPLVGAVPALGALAALAPRDDRGLPAAPLFTLLVLSLPLLATLDYVLGFPIRVVTGWCAARLLEAAGLAVEARGTTLHWAGEIVLIDAPCGGIRMLWFAAVASATLACLHRLPPWRFFALAQAAATVVFLGNLVRTTVLFLLETGLSPNPAWAHEAVGLAVFAGALGVCTLLAARLAGAVVAIPRADEAFAASRFQSPLVAACVSAALIAGTLPFLDREDPPPTPAGSVAWPTHFEGAPLEPAPLHPLEERLARGFPGRIAAFTDGERRIVVRLLERASRKVHPVAGCLRALGFDVALRPAIRQRESGLWSVVAARRGAETLRARERLEGPDGRVWTDVSAWYWAALLDPAGGPWWSVTVLEGPGGSKAGR